MAANTLKGSHSSKIPNFHGLCPPVLGPALGLGKIKGRGRLSPGGLRVAGPMAEGQSVGGLSAGGLRAEGPYFLYTSSPL